MIAIFPGGTRRAPSSNPQFTEINRDEHEMLPTKPRRCLVRDTDFKHKNVNSPTPSKSAERRRRLVRGEDNDLSDKVVNNQSRLAD
jgi:hypothetical protein